MYKSFTPENHKAVLGLPEDYCVSRFLLYGITEEEKLRDKIKTSFVEPDF